MRITSDLYGMTLTRRCGDFVFVIAILWIFTIHLCRADEEIVKVEKGGSVTLPCMYHGDGDITGVRWSKSDSLIVEYRGEQLKPHVISPHYTTVPNRKYKKDFSIILSPVEIHHEGIFTCTINVWGKVDIVKTINLEVTAKPQVEFIMNKGLKASGQLVTVASCTARNGRPSAAITWMSQLGGKANETRNESNGLVTIVSDYQVNLTDESDGKKVSCQVKHSSLEKNPWIKEGTIVLAAKLQVEFIMYNELKANGHCVTVARCTARNGRPPAIITWISQLGGKPNETRNESNGLVTIVSDYQVNLTDESAGEKVSCRVQHSSLEKNPWIKEGTIVFAGTSFIEKLIKYLGITLGLLLLLLLLTALILFKRKNLSSPCNLRKCSGNEDCNELSVTYAAVHVRGRGSEEASTVVSSKLEGNSEYAEICSKKPTSA